MHIGAFFVHFGNTFAALPAIAAMAWGLVFFATPQQPCATRVI